MSSTTPTTSTPFTLTRASLSDIPEIARLMYRCFPTLVREVLMGCNSEADLPRFIAFHEDEFRTHHHAVWVKVVDATSGRIAAASRWKVYPNAGTPADGGDKVMSWLDDERRAQAERILGSMNAAREQANPGGFVHLHILCTSPDFRRQGAGGLMMQWGCDLADILSVPAWIEASAEGKALYQVHGFVDVETTPGLGDVTFMQRKPKGMSREGGHVQV